MEAGDISRRGNAVKISNKERGKGGGGDGCQGSEGVKKGLPLAPEVVSRGGMEMHKPQSSAGDKLGVAWEEFLHRRARDT